MMKRSVQRLARGAPCGRAVLALVAAFGLATSIQAHAGELEAGGFSFSDELGGFRILSASGAGTARDPITIVEEIEEVAPITLVIRRVRADRVAALGSEATLYLIKEVANRSNRVWAGFELELQEELRKPSIYTDGLSFNQFGAREPDVQSDSFAANNRLFEPHDRVRFQNGHVDPEANARFQVTITDPTPTRIFYLVQDPQLLSASLPGNPATLASRLRP